MSAREINFDETVVRNLEVILQGEPAYEAMTEAQLAVVITLTMAKVVS
jgi:hypothetical protein